MKQSWPRLLLIMVLRFAESVPFFLATVFAVSYATGQLGVNSQLMLFVVMLTCVLAFPMHAFFGALSDKFGRRPVYIFGAVFAAIFVFPFFYFLESGSFALMLIAYILFINIAHNSINSVQPSFFTEMFGIGSLQRSVHRRTAGCDCRRRIHTFHRQRADGFGWQPLDLSGCLRCHCLPGFGRSGFYCTGNIQTEINGRKQRLKWDFGSIKAFLLSDKPGERPFVCKEI
ncbi:hypothetical protein QS257_20585 [Terrilactibacillus sp. S3-3]|nr:hypothetical protein QS257_20585 [Terrilactibacillus sp. S3-3]